VCGDSYSSASDEPPRIVFCGAKFSSPVRGIGMRRQQRRASFVTPNSLPSYGVCPSICLFPVSFCLFSLVSEHVSIYPCISLYLLIYLPIRQPVLIFRVCRSLCLSVCCLLTHVGQKIASSGRWQTKDSKQLIQTDDRETWR
jgi:hypothetical protein